MGKTAVSWADVSSSSSVLRFFLRLVMICYTVIEVLAWYLATLFFHQLRLNKGMKEVNSGKYLSIMGLINMKWKFD